MPVPYDFCIGAFNQEKALVGAFSVIVQQVVEPMDRFTALMEIVKRNHSVLATQHPAQSYTVTMKISQLRSVHSVQSVSVWSTFPFPSISFNYFFSLKCGFASAIYRLSNI